jgi:hypothetical protein
MFSLHVAASLLDVEIVWHTFTPLAVTSKAVNLGQGFPGWTPPDFVKAAAADVIIIIDATIPISSLYLLMS